MKKKFNLSKYSFFERLVFLFIIIKVNKYLITFRDKQVKIGICSIVNLVGVHYSFISRNKIERFISFMKEYYIFKVRKSIPDKEYWWYHGRNINIIDWNKPRINFINNMKKELLRQLI